MKAGDDASLSIGKISEQDDFDHWVSGRIDSVSAATSSALQYTSSPYYASGFADLSTYGSWFSCGGYGFGWRPFGVGYGWSPFAVGQWIWDPAFGWTYLSSQPWGWAPYHYGGWLFDNSCGGWFYSPPYPYGFVGVPRRHFPPRIHPPRPVYHPVTGVFVRHGGKFGIVPMHPLDQKGKTPLNLEHGVFVPSSAKGAGSLFVPAEPGAKWQALKSAPHEALGSSSLVAAAPPNRVSRTVLEGKSGVRVVSLSKDSSIAYDPHERRFVNTNSPAREVAAGNAKEIHTASGLARGAGTERIANITGKPGSSVSGTPSTGHTPGVPQATRGTGSPPSRSMAPPPAPHYSSGGGSSGGGSSASGGGSRYSSGGGSGRSSAPASSGSASHPSAPSSSGRAH
jgi:hypothetical protein